MPVTKVYSKWEAGDLVFYNAAGTELLRFDESLGQVQINQVAIDSATLDELAALNGLTASVAELNLLDGSVAGTAVASKAAVLGANKNLDVLAVADLKLGAGAGVSVTATAAELNALDGITAGVAELNILDGVTADASELNKLDGVTADTAEINILDGVTATAAEINGLDDSAAFADGLSRVRLATATYDFAVDGGAISAIDLGVTIPDNAIILDGMVDVITTLTSATDAATIALHAESANDIVTAVAILTATDWDAGLRPIKPLGTSATAVKTTAARAITATIAVEAVTAGKFVVFLRYVLSA